MPICPKRRKATSLAADIRGNPERLAMACEQMNQRTAAMYLTLAESWVEEGSGGRSDRVLREGREALPQHRVKPTSRLRRSTKLRANGATSPAGLQKP